MSRKEGLSLAEQLDLLALIVSPPRGTQAYEILMYLQAGKTLTVAKALHELGVYALSQRIGELKKAGWPIQSRTIQVGPKTFVSEYSMASA